MLILSLIEARPRHGYEISKLIEQRSGGAVRFHVASLYPLLYRLERRAGYRGAGSKKAASVAAGIIGSRGTAAEFSLRSFAAGANLWPASSASRRRKNA